MIYIAGPLTHPDEAVQAENIRVATRAYLQLVRVGVPAICPHLSGLADRAFEVEYPRWIENGLAQLRLCAGVWLLPRWHLSRGTLLELAEARRLQLPVYHSLYALLSHRGELSRVPAYPEQLDPCFPRARGAYWDDMAYGPEVIHV